MNCECEEIVCEECRKKAEESDRISQALMDSIRKVPHKSAEIIRNHFDQFLSENFRGLSARATGDGPALSFRIEFFDGSSVTWDSGK